MRAVIAAPLVCAMVFGLPACNENSGGLPEVADGAGQTSEPPAAQASNWSVRMEGAGPIRFGMTLAEARDAAHDSLPVSAVSDSCGYVTPRSAPAGLSFMTEAGRVVRVDVTGPGAATDRGASVGLSEAAIRRLYPDSIVVRPHKYEPGSRYLIVVPLSQADSLHRLVFELAGDTVSRFRAGLRPAAEYVEGCG